MPRRRAVRMIRQAISPRLAMRREVIMAGPRVLPQLAGGGGPCEAWWRGARSAKRGRLNDQGLRTGISPRERTAPRHEPVRNPPVAAAAKEADGISLAQAASRGRI